MDPISLLIIGRIIERIAIVAIAGLSIWVGFKLFFHTLPPQEGEVDLKDFKIKLTSVGPGIFFAVFGVVLMYQVVNVKLDIETETVTKIDQALPIVPQQPVKSDTSQGHQQRLQSAARDFDSEDIQRYVFDRTNLSFLTSTSTNMDLFTSINTIRKLSQDFPHDDEVYYRIGDIDRKKLSMAARHLTNFRNSFALNIYGDDGLKKYKELKKKASGVSKSDREFVTKLDLIFEETINPVITED